MIALRGRGGQTSRGQAVSIRREGEKAGDKGPSPHQGRRAGRMSAELEPVDRERELVLPVTGELIDLRDNVQVAHALDQAREFKRLADELRKLFEWILKAEATRMGTKTLHLGEWVAEVKGSSRLVYDIEELRDGLREAGLPEERLNKLIQETVTYTVKDSVARELAGANSAYKEVLDRTRTREEGREYVYVKRKGARDE